jgi:Ribbon-helix-helix domain
MTMQKRRTHSVALDPVKAELLAVLSRETRIPRAELLREAVDDLLAKYLRLARERAG